MKLLGIDLVKDEKHYNCYKFNSKYYEFNAYFSFYSYLGCLYFVEGLGTVYPHFKEREIDILMDMAGHFNDNMYWEYDIPEFHKAKEQFNILFEKELILL